MRRILVLVMAAVWLSGLAAWAQEPAQPQKPQLLKINKGPVQLDVKLAQPPKSAPAGGPEPKIVCDQPVYDFGAVPQGQEVVHAFTIKNKGKGALKIESARGG